MHQRVGSASGGADDAARGISGGERRRLSIAKVMILNPAILLMDEYTTGLDSETALSTTRVLRAVADSGRQVIATIHQPSSEIFFHFDKVCLLCEGHSVFFGAPRDVLKYFGTLGPDYVCPKVHERLAVSIG